MYISSSPSLSYSGLPHQTRIGTILAPDGSSVEVDLHSMKNDRRPILAVGLMRYRCLDNVDYGAHGFIQIDERWTFPEPKSEDESNNSWFSAIPGLNLLTSSASQAEKPPTSAKKKFDEEAKSPSPPTTGVDLTKVDVKGVITILSPKNYLVEVDTKDRENDPRDFVESEDGTKRYRSCELVNYARAGFIKIGNCWTYPKIQESRKTLLDQAGQALQLMVKPFAQFFWTKV